MDAGLNNIAQGNVGGTLQSDFAKYPLYWKWHHAPDRTYFPGGESLADVQSRVSQAVGLLDQENALNVIVSHTTPMQVLMTILLDLPVANVWRFYFAHFSLTVTYGETLLANNVKRLQQDWISLLRE